MGKPLEDISAQLNGMYQNTNVYQNISDEMQSLGVNSKHCSPLELNTGQ